MSNYTEEITDKLNDIIEKNIDAQKGFGKAAENADSIGLKNYFKEKATERQKFIHDLKQEVNYMGEDAEDSGSLTGAAHRTWMDVKALFSAADDESMLEESIRGEKSAVEEYREVLKHDLPIATVKILEEQLLKIEDGLLEIKTLEDLVD